MQTGKNVVSGKNAAKAEPAPGLVAGFGELAAMRRYVPYLKTFKLNRVSVSAGDNRSSFKGRGMEFEEVRVYGSGDDARDIDWRVTARKNQPYSRVYTEEKDREVFVWTDMSAAMRFGTRKELKSVTAARTAALLGWYALENKDRFGLAVFDGRQTHVFAPRRTQDNLLFMLKKIEQISAGTLHDGENGGETAAASLQALQKKMGRRGILFIISGFDDFGEQMQRQVSFLAKSHEVYLVNIFDALEDTAPPPGDYPVLYNGVEYDLHAYGKNFAEIYQKHFAEKRKKIRFFCINFNCRYREIRSDWPIYKQLRPV